MGGKNKKIIEPEDEQETQDSATELSNTSFGCGRHLDPRRELCLYLKGVAEARDVPSYVKDHPFGQPAVTSAHPHWEFYSRVKQSLLTKRAPRIV
ncbi:hypothetical protein VNO80_06490 [Phaseolus coccineus]|uniref:Uncharacterized protein n=1 Tax=Phaseolus coccineus TaxID=3886 RepID=A0AAN9NLV0_PHACN